MQQAGLQVAMTVEWAAWEVMIEVSLVCRICCNSQHLTVAESLSFAANWTSMGLLVATLVVASLPLEAVSVSRTCCNSHHYVSADALSFAASWSKTVGLTLVFAWILGWKVFHNFCNSHHN